MFKHLRKRRLKHGNTLFCVYTLMTTVQAFTVLPYARHRMANCHASGAFSSNIYNSEIKFPS